MKPIAGYLCVLILFRTKRAGCNFQTHVAIVLGLANIPVSLLKRNDLECRSVNAGSNIHNP